MGARFPLCTAMPTNDNTPRTSAQAKTDKEMLFKGGTCALIGLVILLAPYVARSGSVRDLMAQATLVGWFALVLGGGFIVNYLLRRAKRKP